MFWLVTSSKLDFSAHYNNKNPTIGKSNNTMPGMQVKKKKNTVFVAHALCHVCSVFDVYLTLCISLSQNACQYNESNFHLRNLKYSGVN